MNDNPRVELGFSRVIGAAPHRSPLCSGAAWRRVELMAPAPLRIKPDSRMRTHSDDDLVPSQAHDGLFFRETAEKYRNSQVLFLHLSIRTLRNSKVHTIEGGMMFAAGHHSKSIADSNCFLPPQSAADERIINGVLERCLSLKESHIEILQSDPCRDLINILLTPLFYLINKKYLSDNIFCKQTDCCRSGCRNITIHHAFIGKFRKISEPKMISARRDLWLQLRSSQSHALTVFAAKIHSPVFTYSTAFQHNLHFNFFHGDCPWGYFLQGEPSWDHSTACN